MIGKKILVAVAALVMATVASPSAEAIVGGEKATGKYSAMVSIQTNVADPGDPTFHVCGGTLISERKVQTNAHCFTFSEGTPIPAQWIFVQIGNNNRLKGTFARVAEIDSHPDWHWGEGAELGVPVNDVMVLHLDRSVKEDPLAIVPQVGAPGIGLRTLGWGLTDPAAVDVPLKLQQEDIVRLPDANCQGGDIPLTAGEFCGTGNACYGDSGGPAMQEMSDMNKRWQLAGSVSRIGDVCGNGEPTIFTDVAYHRAFIEAAQPSAAASSSAAFQSRHNSVKSDHNPWGVRVNWDAVATQRP